MDKFQMEAFMAATWELGTMIILEFVIQNEQDLRR